MMGRTLAAVPSTTRPISSLAQSSRQTLNAAGALERYQYCQTIANDCFSNNAPEPAMTVASRNLQVITGRAAREGGRERVCFSQKHRRDEKMAMWARELHSAAALHLVPRRRPQASIVLSA